MLSDADIVSKLKENGCRDADIPGVIQDIGLIICGKAIAQYMEKLPEEERARIRTLQPQELNAYVEEKNGILPRLSQEAFDTIHDQTWQEYFDTVTNTKKV